jgi:hypothetical protein
MSRFARRTATLVGACAVVAIAGCSDRDPAGLEWAQAPVDPLIFDDAWSPDVYFQPFFETHYTAVTVDSVYAFDGFAPDGARSLKVEIPTKQSALGPYAGGVFTAAGNRDLTEFNALTFYARTNADGIVLNLGGFGNDNTGTSLFEVNREKIPLTRDWQQVVIPIPAPSKLISERGLFTFAEGWQEAPGQPGTPLVPDGYDIWFDEVRFAQVDGVEPALSIVGSAIRRYFVGWTAAMPNGTTQFNTPTGVVQVTHSGRYFDLASSDPSVAIPTERGDVRVVGEGSARITGSLDGFAAGGQILFYGHEPPTTAAATPTLPAADVISMFSDAYPDVPVTTWRANWDGVTTQLQDYPVAGQATKMYYDLNYVGVDFIDNLLDVSEMDFLHVDVYAPAGTTLTVEIQSLAAPPDPATQKYPFSRLTFGTGTTPAFIPGQWSSLDIPLDDFTLPAEWDWSRMGILVFEGSYDVQLLLVDNVYWHK